MEVDALAPVHEPAEEPHDLAEARREVPVVAVGHGDAVEAEPLLAVGALQGAELDALARQVGVVLEREHGRDSVLVAEPRGVLGQRVLADQEHGPDDAHARPAAGARRGAHQADRAREIHLLIRLLPQLAPEPRGVTRRAACSPSRSPTRSA